MLDQIVAALMPAAWFYCGHVWAHALRDRRGPVVIGVPCAPASDVDAVMTAQAERMAFRARICGPGFVIVENGSITFDALHIGVCMTLDTDQCAPAAGADARRGDDA